jgi:hypothetical protein
MGQSFEEQQGTGAGLQYWYHADALGSIGAVSNQSGRSVHEYFYDPYGAILDNNGHPQDSSNWTDPHPLRSA